VTTWTNANGIDADVAREIVESASAHAKAMQAVRAAHPEAVDAFSATDLVSAPRLLRGRRAWEDQIVQDVGEGLKMFVGRAVHAYMHSRSRAETLSEERMAVVLTVDGKPVVITGQVDSYEEAGGGLVKDWKTTSVWSWKLGDKQAKPEHERQLNIYAWLLREHGFSVGLGEVAEFYLDWKKSEARRAKAGQYPPCGQVTWATPIWDYEDQLAYVTERARLHLRYRESDPESVPVCDAEERWQRPGAFKCKRTGMKKALNGGVFEVPDYASAGDAHTAAMVKLREFKAEDPKRSDDYFVDIVMGRDVRCADFCDLRYLCSHGRTVADRPPEEAA
jgi:PD-(D/E)XK nuclease superfamily protein